ncbi:MULTISPECIES: ABC transporter ATP-binding protein [unclassified Corynebacterium]|uniref:ABC transporter ATP-binding protein n=1 Tax=unclassified Corynebacterium TaxID=2624378 RepID=UPI0008A57C25|nr:MULTISPECIES: ABC transporter ATP-binding protein [unclassified Corynebacterium]OFK65392.1 ABC transporter ATP-binding protein [Corynebacterium sp. HMSC074A09]OFK65773.1 ABC transporter ATP-binding protein [Corynebacterium sp. HMSC076G08]OFN38360.1 ABC transporter ATP-binding protein [Corynebacterium sp. HMSC072A04]OFO94222.1 ABC transporter ATP-binding protein [Corynebacterium sp. HMSC034H07]OFQ55484.1 ABC transporter ATP-binding protein [Corynebacterium sp. HMSC074H12]
MLKVDKISKTFFPGTVNERRALRDVSLELASGDFVTVIGSNGAGKSTLLNSVAGRLIPDSGKISIDGQEVTSQPEHKRARKVGRVFQDPMAGTAPNLTIEENLSLAYLRGKKRGLGLGLNSARRAIFVEQLESLELGLEKRLGTKVGLLSGGQRQALSLLMAGFTNPKVMLLDEHTAALDPQRAELVTTLTKRIVEQGQLTTLMVTHNMAQALQVGNRLIMMHEGEIIYSADAEQKAKLTVEDLMAEFAKIKGATSDRTLLQ